VKSDWPYVSTAFQRKRCYGTWIVEDSNSVFLEALEAQWRERPDSASDAQVTIYGTPRTPHKPVNMRAAVMELEPRCDWSLSPKLALTVSVDLNASQVPILAAALRLCTLTNRGCLGCLSRDSQHGTQVTKSFFSYKAFHLRQTIAKSPPSKQIGKRISHDGRRDRNGCIGTHSSRI
jgi:hypothetical protein